MGPGLDISVPLPADDDLLNFFLSTTDNDMSNPFAFDDGSGGGSAGGSGHGGRERLHSLEHLQLLPHERDLLANTNHTKGRETAQLSNSGAYHRTFQSRPHEGELIIKSTPIANFYQPPGEAEEVCLL